MGLVCGLILGGELAVLQAPMFDGLSLDPFTLLDDYSRYIIKLGGEEHPAPADDLEVGKIGLPHLVRARGLGEAVAAAGSRPVEVAAFSGHSLGVEAAQDLLCAGFDTAAITRAGGWKSINVLRRYIELAEHNVWE